MNILLALLLGPADAVRGGQFPRIKAQIGGAVYSTLVGLMLTHDPLFVALFAVAFFAGESTGWGCPLGHVLTGKYNGCEYEWWQRGYLRTNPWAALVVRGFIWGLPVGVAGYFTGVDSAMAMPVIMAVSMTAAPALALFSLRWRPNLPLWPMQEWVRGWMTGLLILIVTAIVGP